MRPPRSAYSGADRERRALLSRGISLAEANHEVAKMDETEKIKKRSGPWVVIVALIILAIVIGFVVFGGVVNP
jgi:hypothetical protein